VPHHVAAIVLAAAGGVLIIAGLVDHQDSLGRIILGAGLLLAGTFADRLQRAKVGPGGAEIELERRAREATSGLSVRAPPAVQAPFALPPGDQVVDVQRVALANEVVSFLTHPSEGPLAGCAFQLFVYDAEEELLVPVLHPGHPGPSPGFAPGEGVVGSAWETCELAIAAGAELSVGSFALSADKRARYADLDAVAAAPVVSASGQVIAVLSAASTEPDALLTTDKGWEALMALAASFARVLVDLVKWFSDG
jgi:hypothetical protein